MMAAASPGPSSDDIIIKKRRRRTTVDPCLGYFERPYVNKDSAEGRDCTTQPVILVKGTSSPQMDESREDAHTNSTCSTDKRLNTPPDEAPLVTVDSFLQGQCSSWNMKRKQARYSTRSRKTKRYAAPNSAAATSINLVDEYFPTTPTSTRRKPRKIRNKTRSKLPERIGRAGIMSHVDMEDLDLSNHLDSIAAPLSTVPYDAQAPPSSPLPSKRAKLVNSNHPRQLEDFFSNKENMRSTTKSFKPFSHWNPQAPRVIASCSPSTRSKQSKIGHNVYHRPDVTPLKLVSFGEHSQSLSAKYSKKINRRTVRRLSVSNRESLDAGKHGAEEDPFSTDDLSVLRDNALDNAMDSLNPPVLDISIFTCPDIPNMDSNPCIQNHLTTQADAGTSEPLATTYRSSSKEPREECMNVPFGLLGASTGADTHHELTEGIHASRVAFEKASKKALQPDKPLLRLGSLLNSLLRSVGSTTEQQTARPLTRARKRCLPRNRPVQSSPGIHLAIKEGNPQMSTIHHRARTVSASLSDLPTHSSPARLGRSRTHTGTKTLLRPGIVFSSIQHGLALPLTQIPPPVFEPHAGSHGTPKTTSRLSALDGLNAASTSVSDLDLTFPDEASAGLMHLLNDDGTGFDLPAWTIFPPCS